MPVFVLTLFRGFMLLSGLVTSIPSPAQYSMSEVKSPSSKVRPVGQDVADLLKGTARFNYQAIPSCRPIDSGGVALDDIFKALPLSDYSVKDGTTLLVKNMPPVESQGGLPICHGYSAAAIVQQYLCEVDNWDCQHLSQERKIAPIGMATYSKLSDAKKKINDFEGYEGVVLAGSGALNLINGAVFIGMTYSNICYPYEKVVAENSNDTRVLDDKFEKLKSSYKDAHRDPQSACIDCLADELQRDFDKKVAANDLKAAVAQDTFEKFLYSTLLYGCDEVVEIVPKPVVHVFPSATGGAAYKRVRQDEVQPSQRLSSYGPTIEKIRGVLATGRPVQVDGICVDGKPNACKSGHSVVIAGYREMCSSSGKGCREALLIHNSWGEDWQEKHDGGWVDAYTLLETTGYASGTLSWLTDPLPTSGWDRVKFEN
ncbi:hypothetical protein LFL96_12020 [Paraburkholderia sp. D15]|uniref:hypothetical protein n=1 Tax=Paraburkholderia sp. D15 TaxID=2880218 RepID=UPI002478E152|nr:hypothetical protein [Paraburkholderia sp. D15]WGS48515.1 hypothetical protein LFL96_12020 [Paraburkholderia sp. D15]